MLKPLGALSLASGSLSSAAANGGAGTGASFAAAGLLSGRPISGEPGGSAAAAGAAGAGAAAAGAGAGAAAGADGAGACGGAICWAMAVVASRASVAASNVPRDTRLFIMFLPSAEVRALPASLMPVSDISASTRNRVAHDSIGAIPAGQILPGGPGSSPRAHFHPLFSRVAKQ